MPLANEAERTESVVSISPKPMANEAGSPMAREVWPGAAVYSTRGPSHIIVVYGLIVVWFSLIIVFFSCMA